jgi:uncharacterized RDD family membrane protein YckC
MVLATLWRRYICLVYDAFLLAAILFLAGLLVVGLHPGEAGGLPKPAYQVYLLVVVGFYYVWFWRHGGQTLAMKTWHIRLVDAAGGTVSSAQAWKRYVLLVLTFGIGFIWAVFDRDRQFLHDRLAGTRLIRT